MSYSPNYSNQQAQYNNGYNMLPNNDQSRQPNTTSSGYNGNVSPHSTNYNNNGYLSPHSAQSGIQYIPRTNSAPSEVRHRQHHSHHDYTTASNDTTHVNLLNRFTRRIRSADIYHKTDTDYTIQSSTGGIITLISFVIITLLMLNELMSYIWPPIHHQLKVETRTTDLQRLNIYLNITFPSLTCHQIGIDVMDVSGETSIDSHDNLYRVKLASDGGWMDQPYTDDKDEDEPPMFIINQNGQLNLQAGVSTSTQKRRLLQNQQQLENSLQKLRDNLQHMANSPGDHNSIPMFHPRDTSHDGVGCMLYGRISVGRVGGNLHMAIGGAHHHRHETHNHPQHVHNFMPHEFNSFNASHIINSLSFGDSYPGQMNPLDSTQNIVTDGVGHFKYFIKVVPTTYNYALYSIESNQYSVTNHTIPITGTLQQQLNTQLLPGLFIIYDFSPFTIAISSHNTRLFGFITTLFAIVGGVFTIAGVIDTVVFSISKKLR